MPDDKADPNQVKYKGGLVDGQLILTSCEYPSQFVGEDGQVVATCETLELHPEPLVNAITFEDDFAWASTSFCAESLRMKTPCHHVVMHRTIGGKGVVARITKE